MEWISVKERLPELNVNVLGYIGKWRDCPVPDGWGDDSIQVMTRVDDGWSQRFDGWHTPDGVTHWMPLPPVPE